MKKVTLYVFFALVFFFLSVIQVSAWEGVVVKVMDGDSLKVRRDGKIVEVRLYGIDTPEYKQPYSNKAKQFTKKMTYNLPVSVTRKDVDRYGRVVALLTSRGKLVNRELVREGLAWYYPRYCTTQPLCGELDSLEQKARKLKKGLWRDKNPVSPWDWKRSQGKKGSKSWSGRYYSLLDRWKYFLHL